jgi:hypothetical protein
LTTSLRKADFLLGLADKTWFDELELCPRRAFIDGDPVFTQLAMIEEEPVTVKALRNYEPLFTIGSRIGQSDCTIPTVGRTWIPTRSVVNTRLWGAAAAVADNPLTTVMQWTGRAKTFQGRLYAHKDKEFSKFVDLPKMTQKTFSVAIGGNAPRERLQKLGWQLANPMKVTGTLEAYGEFIANSFADFGIAKHGYVASRSGWFSDRSLCYLASGRPVIHENTGFADWLPVGEGIFPFSTTEDVLEALERLELDYDSHCRSARRIAEEYFEATAVIHNMLAEADFIRRNMR